MLTTERFSIAIYRRSLSVSFEWWKSWLMRVLAHLNSVLEAGNSVLIPKSKQKKAQETSTVREIPTACSLTSHCFWQFNELRRSLEKAAFKSRIKVDGETGMTTTHCQSAHGFAAQKNWTSDVKMSQFWDDTAIFRSFPPCNLLTGVALSEKKLEKIQKKEWVQYRATDKHSADSSTSFLPSPVRSKKREERNKTDLVFAFYSLANA